VKETIGEREDECEGAPGEKAIASALDDAIPEGFVLAMQLDATGDFQQPGETKPGTGGVAEGVKDLSKKPIGKGEGDEVHIVDGHGDGVVLTIRGEIEIKPGGRFDERNMEVHLAMVLERVEIVMMRRDVGEGSGEAGFL
jgi:hypothetical protein